MGLFPHSPATVAQKAKLTQLCIAVSPEYKMMIAGSLVNQTAVWFTRLDSRVLIFSTLHLFFTRGLDVNKFVRQLSTFYKLTISVSQINRAVQTPDGTNNTTNTT